MIWHSGFGIGACRSKGKFWCYCFQVLGTEDGPSVHTKFVLNLDYCSFLIN